MCGIAGLIDPAGGPIDRALLARMTSALEARGPDGEGSFHGPGVGLGHRRLKVIDLSDAASQPMGSDDGQLQLVLNGEIYNFSSLRDELASRGARFRSRSDTEVLLRGYEAWGDGVIDRIEGMFAFALWDARRRRLLCARDRLGKKPFYYARIPRDGGRPALFAFASELKALLPVPGLDRSLDPAALSRYLTCEYVPPPFSIVRGARKLDAAERLVLDVARDAASAPVVDRYWQLPIPDVRAPRREDEAAEELHALLRRAVSRRLVSDAPLGLFLSGGIDSSTVAALMTRTAGAAWPSFSLGFTDPAFDETAYARLAARALGTDHHEIVLSPEGAAEALADIGGFLDEPLADSSLLPTYVLSRFARRHVTVALSGEGSDELFAGYPTFRVERVVRATYDRAPALARGLARALAERLPPAAHLGFDFKRRRLLRGLDERGPRRLQSWLAAFLPSEQKDLLVDESVREELRDAPDALDDVARRAAQHAGRPADDATMDFYCGVYLPGDINVKVDRASGAVGLEVRCPFLDHDVVRFACALPPHLRMRGLAGKVLLKRAMAGRLPRELLRRRKQGFAMPLAAWCRTTLAPLLREELHPDKLRREGLFAPAVVTRLLDDHMAGRADNRKALWTLLVFERWLATWGAGALT